MIWAEKVKLYRILQRDCRSDKTFEWVGIYRPENDAVKLYKWNKKHTKLLWDRTISEIILTEKLISTGTSMYELQEEGNEGINS